jgi:hypothetical protein
MTKERTSNDQMLALSLSQRDENKTRLILSCPLFKVATGDYGHRGRYLMAGGKQAKEKA